MFDLVVVSVSLASLGFSFPGVTALRLVRTIRLESCDRAGRREGA